MDGSVRFGSVRLISVRFGSVPSCPVLPRPALLCPGMFYHALLLVFPRSLSQYSGQCDWLRDEKFLKDMEGDSVDTEILDEELRSLQEDGAKTWVVSNGSRL